MDLAQSLKVREPVIPTCESRDAHIWVLRGGLGGFQQQDFNNSGAFTCRWLWRLVRREHTF
jgi:hypothetical protein